MAPTTEMIPATASAGPTPALIASGVGKPPACRNTAEAVATPNAAPSWRKEALVAEAIPTSSGSTPPTTALATPAPDAVLTGPPQLTVGVLIGRVNLDDAKAQGLRYDGDPAILQRVQPAEVVAV